jgi:hypothetical protein
MSNYKSLPRGKRIVEVVDKDTLCGVKLRHVGVLRDS